QHCGRRSCPARRSAAPPRTALVQLCATESLYVHARRSRSSTAFTTAPISTASLRCARLPTAGFSKSKPKSGTTEPFRFFTHDNQRMPTPAPAPLRAAVHVARKNNAALNTLLGGSKVYDEPPRGATFPYVTLGETRISNFSSGDQFAEEHQLTLHAWSRQGGHREAHLITGTLLQVLDD